MVIVIMVMMVIQVVMIYTPHLNIAATPAVLLSFLSRDNLHGIYVHIIK